MTTCDQVSAVIPAFNREALIGRAIESVLAQTLRPGEIIVVDDGSADETAARAESYEGVTCVRQPNGGAAAARNAGVRHATAPWIALLDSDDLWLPDHVEKMWEAVEQTGGRARFYFTDLLRPVDGVLTSHWARCGFDPGGSVVMAEDGADWTLLPRRPQMLQASLIRRDDFLAAGGCWPRLKMSDDGHLFAKLAMGQPICAVAHAGVQMTDDASSDQRLFATGMRRQTVAYQREVVATYDDLLARFPDAPERYRSLFRQRRTGAHRRLARMLLAERDVLGAGRHLGSALSGDPRLLTTRALGRVRRVVARRT